MIDLPIDKAGANNSVATSAVLLGAIQGTSCIKSTEKTDRYYSHVTKFFTWSICRNPG